MNAKKILEHFFAVCDWVDPSTTVDRVIFGDPEKEIRSAVVTWISSSAACREAATRRADLLVTHEPTFWVHRNEDPDSPDPIAARKRKFLEQSGLTVLRIHDSWDRFPEVGIPFAWAKFLGLEGPPVAMNESQYQHRYDIEPIGAGAFARRVASRTATLGEPIIQFAGDADKVVSRIGVGTGCGCDVREYEEMGCDLFVVCDDGSCYWSGIQRSVDAGFCVIRVNHGTSEEPGMVTLAKYLNDTFPAIRTEHLPHPCCYVAMGQGEGAAQSSSASVIET